jgi:hypothetical protein
MSSNLNLNDLWKSQYAPQPAAETLIAKWKKTKRSNLRRVLFTNILFTITSLFIIWIWIAYNPQLLTTKTGIVLVILAMAVYGLAYNSLKPLIKEIDSSSGNKEYLEKLLLLKSRQQFLHNTMLNIYFILLSAGLFLYMIEPAMAMSVQSRILVYGITAVWILFNWLYVRPKMRKKQEGKIGELIAKVNEMIRDMNNPTRLD